MKKFLNVICSILIMVLCLVCVNPLNIAASATEIDLTNVKNICNSHLINFVQLNSSHRTMLDRRAGTNGEHQAANYIASMLGALGLEAKNNQSTTNGMQQFNFTDDYDQKQTSYNVIYTIKGAKSEKKVVISTYYDNFYYGYFTHEDQVIEDGEDYSEGINASAASVATLLTLAQVLPQNHFNFDIELVFFGASYYGNSGAAFYNQAMNNTERSSVLLITDMSRIALGSHLYFYSGTFGSAQDDYYASKLNFKQYTQGFSGSSVEDYYSKFGYYNAGYSSSTTVFEGGNINILHLFAGDYETGLFGGFCEYSYAQNVTDTNCDSLKYITEKHGDAYLLNMQTTINSLIEMLSDENFQSKMEMPNNKDFYKFFTFNNIYFVLLIILICLMIVSILIHYGLSKKSYNYIMQNQIGGVVIEIDEDNKKEDNKK